MAGRSLLAHILSNVKKVAPNSSIGIVVGHGRAQVEEEIRKDSYFSDLDITFIHQAEQKGTGHAALCAMESSWGEKLIASKSDILVLPGDLPLISEELISQLLEPLAKAEVLRLLTTEHDNPTGYGRVIRKGKSGSVLRIVEEKDASPREKLVREVALSIYTFRSTFLKFGLSRMGNKNAQGEYYLTDLIALAARTRKKMDVLSWMHREDVRGVNDPWELALAARVMNERCLSQWAKKGVHFVDPFSTWVECSVELAPEVVIHPGAILTGKTRVGAKAIIGPYCVIENSEIGASTEVKAGCVVSQSKVGAHCHLGPYAHFRPESQVGDEAKIGNFVELKKTKVGKKTSVAHLSYLGDAEVGNHVNIGCGFVTCNFDGRVINGSRKHKTIIEDEVFMGSDCQCVAPIRIGKGAYVASGSTITQDVAPDALAIARARQVNKPDFARKLRERAAASAKE